MYFIVDMSLTQWGIKCVILSFKIRFLSQDFVLIYHRRPVTSRDSEDANHLLTSTSGLCHCSQTRQSLDKRCAAHGALSVCDRISDLEV